MPALALKRVVSDLVARAAKPQTAADKKEKDRQKRASLEATKIYNYVVGGVLFVFVLRNVLRQMQFFLLARRARLARQESRGTALNEKGNCGSVGQRPKPLRYSDKIDAWLSAPSKIWPLQEWTRIQALLTITIVTVNLLACLVVSTKLHSPATARSNVTRAVSRRCGRIAAANFPILYLFAGRNSVLVLLTGHSYQTIRFYHKLVGFIVFVQSFIHTFAYVGYYLAPGGLGAEALHEEWTEAYFKWGIAALVGGLVNCFFFFRFLRTRIYEILLLTHIVGAVLMLAGSWYHRPIMQVWVYAAVAIWGFERLTRLVLHITNLTSTRSPVVKATARVNNGAVLLSIPFPAKSWSAGQHVYVSFWGTALMRTPWLYGQSHPFSIANTSQDEQGRIELVMRIKTGLTKHLAEKIEALQRNSTSGSEIEVLVSVEGPHGGLPNGLLQDEGGIETLVLVAGGSGITHVSSILSQALSQPSSVLRSVDLIWAIQHRGQIDWILPQIQRYQSLAASLPQIALSINIYITRHGSEAIEQGAIDQHLDTPGTTTELSSGMATPSSVTNERKYSFGDESKGDSSLGDFVCIHRGRPDVLTLVDQSINGGSASRTGRALIVACGPEALAKEVMFTKTSYDEHVQVQIAKFEY